MKTLDCVVIGAGFSGIQAALTLHKAKKKFLIVEANPRLGGRTYTTEISPGYRIDWGGQWIGPGMHRVYRLVEEFKIPLVATYDHGDHLFEDGNGIEKFSGALPAFNPEINQDLDRIVKLIDQLAAAVDTNAPWKAPDESGLSDSSIAQWLDRNVTNACSKRLMKTLFEIQLAADIERVSMLYYLYFVASSGKILGYFTSVTGGALQDRFADGTSSLLLAMSEIFFREVQFSTKITKIVQDNDSVIVHSQNESWQAKHVIVTGAPPTSRRIEYLPPLSLQRQHLFEKFFMGSVIKCMLAYKTPFWREQGLSGQVSSTVGPLISVCDNSPANSGLGVLVVFLVAKTAEEFSELLPAQRQHLVVGELVKYFTTEARSFLSYQDVCWTKDSEGAFFGLLPPGVLSIRDLTISELRVPEARIHWAGSETARQWHGFIEGALESGERAAAEVIQCLEQK